MNEAILNYFTSTHHAHCYNNPEAYKEIEEFGLDNYQTYKLGHVNGCNIDEESKLRYGKDITSSHVSNIQPRMFTGVPNLKKGAYSPDVESRLFMGEMSPQHLGETPINRMDPQIPCVKRHVTQKSANLPEMQRASIITQDYSKGREDERLQAQQFDITKSNKFN